jgi:hypothetical protein
MKRLIFATALLAAALLLGSGCGKEDDDCFDEGNPRCSNYDPCWDRKEAVSAGFEVGNFWAGTNSGYPFNYLLMGDTIFANSTIIFKARDSSAETYEWKVGTDERTWHEQAFHLSFGCDLLHTHLPVRLITTRLRDTSCMEERPLADTMTRQLYFTHLSKAVLFGTYRGHLNKHIDEEYDVVISTDCLHPGPFASNPCRCPSGSRLFLGNLTNEGCELSGYYRNSMTQAHVNRAHFPNDVSDCPILFEEDLEEAFVNHLSISVVGPDLRSIKIHFTYVAVNRVPYMWLEEELEFVGIRVD